MKNKIMKFISYVLCTVGILAAGASSIGCIIILMDEPEMPNSML